ncbi:ribonuclease HII [Patescibacteria group bacterium]|nr:MAG: ribonuclease HII [Patescibacteria group bacterium]
MKPDFTEENSLWDNGYSNVCGIDEVGRGCWAGPLVAGAVIFSVNPEVGIKELGQITDSKKISPKKREQLAEFIIHYSKHWGIGYVDSKELDRIGLSSANTLAMERAVNNLGNKPDFSLIDGNVMMVRPNIGLNKNIVKGDSKSISIAAASILAKVFRDKLMNSIDSDYPEYGFREHKGYGTSLHRKSIQKNGILPIHRMTFAPIKELSK